MTTTLKADQLDIIVHLERGTIGTAECVCRPPAGRRINDEAVERALEHVGACDDKTTTDVLVGLTFIKCWVPLPSDETIEVLELHVKAVVDCLVAGIADFLAIEGQTLTCNASTRSAAEHDRAMVGSFSD